MKSIFQGSAVALITPFNENGVDYKSLEKLLEFQIQNGTDAILLLGTTGEPSTMTHEEEKVMLDFAIKKIDKRVPVIVGAGSNDTMSAIEYCRTAEERGADALLIVSPYYNKTTQKGLVEHYNKIADNVKTPIILYNVPGRTGLNILPSTVQKLAEHENIAAIKEASGNIEQVVEIASLCGDKIDIYSGDDGITVPMMSMGAKGVISVAANIIPRKMSNMCREYMSGNHAAAARMQTELYKLCKSMFIEVNPIPVKTACSLMGLCGNDLRLPLTTMETANLEKLKEVLKEYKLI